MSDYFNALVEAEKFYILPVCNLPVNPSITSDAYTEDETWVEWTGFGYSILTTTGGNQQQYNDNMEEIIIPDYLKKLNIDYISFSSTPSGVATSAGQDVNTIVCNLVYEIQNGLNPFISGDNIEYTFDEETKYYNQIKAYNGELIKIDLKSLYSIRDIIITFTDSLPAPTTTPDKNNKCRPHNITFWKKFFISSPNNKNEFIKQNSLPASCNQFYNEFYSP